MKKKDLLGYLLGLLIFVFLLPAGMWLIAGEVHPGWFQVNQVIHVTGRCPHDLYALRRKFSRHPVHSPVWHLVCQSWMFTAISLPW